jgi:hypothetical protein
MAAGKTAGAKAAKKIHILSIGIKPPAKSLGKKTSPKSNKKTA